jgi:hypothetical protein
VRNIATSGEVKLEKNRITAKREKSFRSMPATAGTKRGSSGISRKNNIAKSTAVWKASMRRTTRANQRNFPRKIDDRAIGFESMRNIVRPSISRAIIPPPRKSITESPVSSIKESPKS